MWKKVEDRKADKTKIKEATKEERKERKEETENRGGDNNNKNSGRKRRKVRRGGKLDRFESNRRNGSKTVP